MSVQFAQQARAIPGYVAGAPAGKAPGVDRRRGHRPAGLERVAVRAAPGGRRGDRARRRRPPTATRTRAPACCGGGSPSATRSTRRGVAVANGSCEILLAAALALCEPGAELVYAWPSFSIYPYLAPLSGAREIRVPLDDGDVHDLDAIADRGHGRDPAGAGLQPEQPDRDAPPGGADRASSASAVPDHVTVIVDEAYVEFQLDDDPDASRRPAPRVPQPGPACARSARSTGSPGCGSATRSCSPKFRAAVDAVRQPFSVNALAQAAAAEAIRHADDVADRVERNIVERVTVEEGVRELGLETPDSQANFSWVDARRRRRGRGRRGARRARDPRPRRDAAGRPRPHPGHATGRRRRTGASSTRWARSSGR